MCLGKHNARISCNPTGATTNYRSHFETFHPEVFNALEQAQADGENPAKTLQTLLQDKQQVKPQKTIDSLWKKSEVKGVIFNFSFLIIK